jgi:aldehyde dehydrogenase (NAD+)
MASSRVYVHESVADKFVELYKAAMVGVMGKKGDPLDPTTTYGPQADKVQYDNICKHLQQAEKEGIKFLLGGPPKGQEQDGLFIPPTLAFNPPEESDLVKQEVFG